jgi:hypothetical protein
VLVALEVAETEEMSGVLAGKVGGVKKLVGSVEEDVAGSFTLAITFAVEVEADDAATVVVAGEEALAETAACAARPAKKNTAKPVANIPATTNASVRSSMEFLLLTKTRYGTAN